MKLFVLLSALLCGVPFPLFADALLTELPRPSRAARSGLIIGDVVKSIGGAAVDNQAALQQMLKDAPDGAEILVFRVDRELRLRLAAAPEARKPHRLRTDWDKAEQEEEQHRADRRMLISLLQADAPDTEALRRCLEGQHITAASFFREKAFITLFLRDGKLFLRVTDEELSSLFELGKDALPAETKDLLHSLPDD